jgi:hypothetical protein
MPLSAVFPPFSAAFPLPQFISIATVFVIAFFFSQSDDWKRNFRKFRADGSRTASTKVTEHTKCQEL